MNNSNLSGDYLGGGGAPDWVARVKCLCAVCAETKEHKHFRPGTPPGGAVTGVTEKLFMCQMFMCLFLAPNLATIYDGLFELPFLPSPLGFSRQTKKWPIRELVRKNGVLL